MWLPTPLFEGLGLTALPPHVLSWLAIAYVAMLVLATVGLLSRSSCLLAAGLSFYLLGLRHCFGKINHGDGIIPILLLTMAVARCGDGFSIDGLVRRLRYRSPHASASATPARSGEYTWPLRLGQVLTVLVLFAAGVAKIRHGGVAWVVSDNLREILLGQHYVPWPMQQTLGFTVADTRWLCVTMAAATIALETLAPLALVSRLARVVIGPALLLFLLALRPLFGFSFWPFYILLVFWLPWEWSLRPCDQP
jgi:hypothetical protein